MSQTPPLALLHPKDGRYSVRAAARLWLSAYYGWDQNSPRSTEENEDYRADRREALQDLGPLIRREYRAASFLGANTFPMSPGKAPAIWIEHTELVVFADQHGLDLGSGNKSQNTPRRKTPQKGRSPNPNGRTPEKYNVQAKKIALASLKDNGINIANASAKELRAATEFAADKVNRLQNGRVNPITIRKYLEVKRKEEREK